MQIRTLLSVLLMAAAPGALALSACSGDDSSETGPGGTGASAGGEPIEGICLLNNCSDDTMCVGCPDGRDHCLVEESRCVACDPNTGEGCAEGETCSPYGICVPDGLTCPTDDEGKPTVVCQANSDCLACSPMNQVCDTDTHKCQACTETNTQHCLSSDICVDTDGDMQADSCSPKCPATCAHDNDCGQCGGPGNEAHACFAHKCAECSETFPCAAGEECINGVCVPPCGLPGPVVGTCIADEDCKFCGDPEAMGEGWTCHYPVNGGDHGNCVPTANGCSDLGNGIAVLPEPYSDFTQLCSNDNDCAQAQAGIQFNVGEALRDLIGGDSIDLGFADIAIHDANVFYAMPKCAQVELTDNISCGICVPCEEDADCAPIDIDPLIQDLFKGEPLAQIAGALLVDTLWGDNDDHNLNFFCQPVAFGYGVCIPCGNPLQACGSGGGGGGNGQCDHDVCMSGGALNGSCSSCAQTVCQNDSFCCDGTNGSWDSLCIDEANQYCNDICNGGNSCAHNPCMSGAALSASCNSCVSSVCAGDAFCCQNSWDATCVSEAQNNPACANSCNGGCIHDECDTGAKLTSGCSTCATNVCAMDSYCCTTDWDSQCVGEADSLCGGC
jgi:hypothetical protein